MTKDEIIKVLEDKGIILNLAGDWMITEKYKILMDRFEQERPVKVPPELASTPVTPMDAFSQLSMTVGNVQQSMQWPEAVRRGADRYRAKALMDSCDIPATDPEDTYRLRGLDQEALKILIAILNDQSGAINPPDFIQAVRNYYRFTDRPKAFKNLLKEDLIFEIYQEFLMGRGPKGDSPDTKPPQSWR